MPQLQCEEIRFPSADGVHTVAASMYTMLGDAGVQDLSCEIWHDARHELHNETNREEVFDYVYGWLMNRLPEDESQ